MKSHFKIEPSILERVVKHLNDAAGIDPASLETGRMTWTIERRCRHLRLQGGAAYLEHLESSPAELEDLIDALVIHETRFFRDLPVFDHLRVWAQGMAEDDAKPLRVLSAPCSTGQEAYSLAATLWSAGVSSFKIDAFDISRTALAAAQLGVYPAGALDHVPGDLQEACGTFLDQHWHMRDELRGRIRFERRNLAIPGALDNEPGYHLILCRNLFIYLHAEARSALAESLSEALLPGGRLVMGAGDRVAEVNARFTPVGPAASFALIHKVTGARSTTPSAAPGQPLRPRAPRFNSPTPQSELATIPTTSVEFYHRALEYKDRGNMRQAERRCRQALYLAPGYLPALELLQTLWHLHPNAHLRRALKARIERARAEREPYLAAKPPAGEKTP